MEKAVSVVFEQFRIAASRGPEQEHDLSKIMKGYFLTNCYFTFRALRRFTVKGMSVFQMNDHPVVCRPHRAFLLKGNSCLRFALAFDRLLLEYYHLSAILVSPSVISFRQLYF